MNEDNPQNYNKLFTVGEFIDINDDLIINGDNVIVKNFNSKYVFDNTEDSNKTFSYDDFNNNDIIILKSSTGTGKTTAISNHIKRCFEEQPEIKLLCITPIKSLASQLHLNFDNINCCFTRMKQETIKKNMNYLKLEPLPFVLIALYLLNI